MLDTEHKIVSTETIREEWHKHQSRFTRTWLVSMVARKRVCWIDAPADEELRLKVQQATSSEKKSAAMLKDIHLLEAALKTDKVVVSMDETVRQCFRETTQAIGTLKHIAWVNPCKDEDAALDWLHNGALSEKERLLGYHEETG
ncbi:MAG: hypothetical protein JOZ18_20555 [Chloroflexi bacterium]|nr:hypothetical protein [Chloroflexota bacterium]